MVSDVFFPQENSGGFGNKCCTEGLSPYSGTPLDCGLDRKGHKLAMAHQRAPKAGAKESASALAASFCRTFFS